MKIFEFLDTNFQITTKKIGEQKGMNYSLMDAGRLQALHASIHMLRVLAKWVQIPLIFTQFLLMKLHLLSEPISPLKEKPVTMTEGGENNEGAAAPVGAKA